MLTLTKSAREVRKHVYDFPAGEAILPGQQVKPMAVSVQPVFPFLPGLSKAEVNLLLQVHTHNRDILYTHACVKDVYLTLVGLSD